MQSFIIGCSSLLTFMKKKKSSRKYICSVCHRCNREIRTIRTLSVYPISLFPLFVVSTTLKSINETESLRSFKMVTWHYLQPASLGSTILIICLLFHSLGADVILTVSEELCSNKSRAVPFPSSLWWVQFKVTETVLALLLSALYWTYTLQNNRFSEGG